MRANSPSWAGTRHLLHCYILELFHIMWIPQRGCWRHRLYLLLSSPINQQPCGLFFHSCRITHWSGDFLQFYCCFCCHFWCCFPDSTTLYGHTCHTCYILPWIIFYSCFSISFLRSSTLEPPILIQTFPVFYSVQLCIPEPTHLFIKIFKFNLCNIDVARYSNCLVFLR